MTYQETAEIQGVTVKTVGSRLYRALKRLAQQLGGYGPDRSKGNLGWDVDPTGSE